MSESQSRYSIVERLTKEKLKLQNEDAVAQGKLLMMEADIQSLKKDFDNWKEDIKEVTKKQEREWTRKIENKIKEFENYEDSIVYKNKAIVKQLKTIDDALKSIEDISKSASA